MPVPCCRITLARPDSVVVAVGGGAATSGGAGKLGFLGLAGALEAGALEAAALAAASVLVDFHPFCSLGRRPWLLSVESIGGGSFELPVWLAQLACTRKNWTLAGDFSADSNLFQLTIETTWRLHVNLIHYTFKHA